MPNLKEVRIRIASVKSTQQITSAMKMVAASKLRKAQNAILKMRPYAAKLKDILQNLSASLDSGDGNLYTQQRTPNKVLIVVLTSNRGLCGAFNTNILRTAAQRIQIDYASQLKAANVSVLTIGRKGTEFFTKRGYNVISSHDSVFDSLTYENVSAIASSVMNAFAGKEFDRVDIVYNQFKNAVVQRVAVEQFLPVEAPAKSAVVSKTNTDYIFLPSKEEIVVELIPKSLKIQFYKSVLDSYASEHGARMTAMHQATDNAGDLIKELNLAYNKARQASITKEILEIVSGAEALKNQ
ncbi:MAG: ATP synthase F1 subunit gamma [Bacteroidales bacterium]|nr:ATP synthase F1 subunit gamma [Bacteroidales bacterium]